jgi:hypothetical protein
MLFRISILLNGDHQGYANSEGYISLDYPIFESGANAAEIASCLNDHARSINGPLRYKVERFEAKQDSDSDSEWHKRENERFISGFYEIVPWHQSHWFADCDATKYHFPHMSKERDGMIAYTPDSTHGKADRQLRVRAGRYLNQFYGNSVSNTTIRAFAAECGFSSDLKVSFATTPDEIYEVYQKGPPSCMSHRDSQYDSEVHPVRVYGAGDLAIAYLEHEEKISARVLCWPSAKQMCRIYGDGGAYENKLRELLEIDGYTFDDLSGAKILKIESGSGYVLPYLDGCKYASVEGDFLVLGTSGDFYGNNTNGLSYEGDQCDGCGEHYNAEDSGGRLDDVDRNYCSECFIEYARLCEGCSEYYHQDNTTYVEDEYFCESCFADKCTNCEECDKIVLQDDATTVGYGTKTVCSGCLSANYTCCDVCSEHIENDRVEHHENLLSQICEDCFAQDYATCAECNDAVKKDDTNSDGKCEDCTESHHTKDTEQLELGLAS